MEKIIGFIVCTLLITATGFSVVGIDENREGFNKNNITSNLEHSPPLTGLFEWPMFRYELNNTGYSPPLAPDDDDVLWSKYIGDWVDSNPTVKDERLYIVGDNYNYEGGADLWCLNPFTGVEIWKTDLPDEFVWGSPTVGNDRVYVLGTYFNLYCLDAYNGNILWTVEAQGHCSPMLVDDKLYYGAFAGYGGFHCLNATTGDEIWVFDASGRYQACTPAIANDKVYIGVDPYNQPGTLYCLDADTGDEIWSYLTTGPGIWSSPTVVNNKVYFATENLYCLDASSGDEIWVESGINTASSPAVAYGNVYIGNGAIDDGKFYCFDADNGDLIWDTPPFGYLIWNGAAIADGKVFFSSCSIPEKINCLDAYTGDILWQYDFIVEGGGSSSPAVAYGNVYVGAGEDGYIYAFGTPNEPPETPSKPDGSIEGIVGVEYIFNTSTTDPEGDDIYYLFDWGDGTNSGWQGPYASGATVNAQHIWTVAGDYEIRAKAHDGRRESNWSEFHTISIIGSEPDLECDGSLSWIDIKPGETVEGNFTLLNTGEPYSLLNWEIESYPEWGIWTFTPEEGYDLTPELEPFVVEVSIVAPDKKNSEFTGEIKIVNSENSSDYCTVDVSLATPKNKAFNFNFPLLEWLFERFPNAFPILRHMLGL